MSATAANLAATLRARRAEARRREEELLTRRLSAAPEAARLLRERFGATRVVLLGSLARGETHADSDVDLAVTGVAMRDHTSALIELERLFGCPIDLIHLGSAPPAMRLTIEQEGREL